MLCQSFVYQFAEFLLIMVKHFCSLLKGKTLWAVAAVVWNVAGCLVGEKLNVDIVVNRIFQKVNDVAVECDGHSFFLLHVFMSQFESFFRGFSN